MHNERYRGKFKTNWMITRYNNETLLNGVSILKTNEETRYGSFTGKCVWTEKYIILMQMICCNILQHVIYVYCKICLDLI